MNVNHNGAFRELTPSEAAAFIATQADATPSAVAQIDMQMAAFERQPGNYMTERGMRELVLTIALTQGAVTDDMLDPGVVLDVQSPEFLALPHMARRAVLVERQMRTWRAQRAALEAGG